MEHLRNDNEDHSNQHENSQKESRKVHHLTKVIYDKKNLTEFTRLISSTRIGKPVLMMDIKVSKDKNISRWVDGENLIYVR